MSIAATIAGRRLRQIRARQRHIKYSIYDNFERLSPNLARPEHLDPFIQVLEEAPTKTIEVCVACPPQHGKTESIKHAIVTWAMNYPGKRHAYSTHNQTRAREVMKEVVALCFEAGLDPHTVDGGLSLSGGTKIRFGGCVAGSLTGFPIDGVHVCDDLLKDMKEAESQVIKNDRWNWFQNVAESRRHPGSSVVLNATRWATDDPSGRAIKTYGYKFIRLAAICDSVDDPNGRNIGDVLWPTHRPRDFLQKFMVNRRTWASLYQGLPQPRGDRLFQAEPAYFSAWPKGTFQLGYGLDLAYTKKTRADYSVMVKGRCYTDKDPHTQKPIRRLYLQNIIRKQCQAPEFTAVLKREYTRDPGPMLWLASGTEKGAAQFLQQEIPRLIVRNAGTDKYVRATPAAETFWNVTAGEGFHASDRVFLPKDAAWVNDFLEELSNFTGVEDGQDDQVDGFATLCLLFLKPMDVDTGVGSMNALLRDKTDIREARF